MSIFVSIASYRDTELPKTVRNMLDTADDPDAIRFGVLDQNMKSKFADLSFAPNIEHKKILFKDARGAGYARKLATELYNGEDFFLQTDSHMRFVDGWDTKLKDMYHWCSVKEGKPEIILSSFPAPFEVLTDNTEHYPIGDKDFWSEPSWTSVVNTYYGAWAGNRERMESFDVPHKTHTVLGALIFSHGKIARDIPYDDRISFMGEELCYAIRAYTKGYELYAPNETIAWHFYKRKEMPKVWGDKKVEWFAIEKASKEAQKSVLLAEDNGPYGIDNMVRYREYQDMIGIDFHEFYKVPPKEVIDLDWVSEEMTFDFDPVIISGQCLNNQHDYCTIDVCACEHHKENNVAE